MWATVRNRGRAVYSRKEIANFAGWPNDKRVAVIPVINVEVFETGKGGPSVQPHLNGLPVEIANSGWREYGNRRGCERLLNIFTELGVPASAVVNSDVVDAEPDLFNRLVSLREPPLSSSGGLGCWVDILGHGKNNSVGMAGKPFPQEMEETRTTLNTLSRGVAHARGESEPARVVGWLSPGFSVTMETPRILAMNGVAATMDATDEDSLYVLTWDDSQQERRKEKEQEQESEQERKEKERQPKGSIAVIPYSMETNDISLCLSRNFTGEEYGNTLIDYITQLCSEKDESQSSSPKVVCLGLHTFIAGTPAKALHLKRAIQTIQKECGDSVWWCNTTMLLQHLHLV